MGQQQLGRLVEAGLVDRLGHGQLYLPFTVMVDPRGHRSLGSSKRLRANAFLPFLINAVQIDVHQCTKFKADF